MKRLRKSVITLLFFISGLGLFAEPEPGLLHLVYDNGVVTYDDTATYMEFDVLLWISEGNPATSYSDILGSGQFYVRYPDGICGDYVVSENNVFAERQGILATQFATLNLYTEIGSGTNDTEKQTFAVVFEKSLSDQRALYTDCYISTDSNDPSLLHHIKLQALESGTDTVWFDPDVNDPNTLFWDYEGNLFASGLDYSEAWEPFVVTVGGSGDPGLPIELTDISASYKEGSVTVNWTTETETENLGFQLLRAESGGEFTEISNYLEDDRLLGQGTVQETHSYSFTDRQVKPGREYTYKLVDVDFAGKLTEHTAIQVSVPQNSLLVSDDYVFNASYPNPFNPDFTVPFQLNTSQSIIIELFNITGQKVMSVVDGVLEPGDYNIKVNANHLNSGVYLLRTLVDNNMNTQKMILLK